MGVPTCDMSEAVPADAVGRRIVCDGHRATVRYVGDVPPTAGLWLGVEWDAPERGKHNGSHEGVHYFTCRHPSSGSFIRPRKASFGVTYLTAMRQRYELDLSHITSQELKICRKTVEMVGFQSVSEKQKVENVTTVSLRGCDVSSAGPENEIRQTTPNVVSLDLSDNLLCSWDDVSSITQQLNHLTELQLRNNRLSTPFNPAGLSHAFTSLTVLNISNTNITWTQVLACAPMWPHLEELYVVDNAITELHKPACVLLSLRVLDLSGNLLANGDELIKIAQLPQLENLYLSQTGITSLQFNDVGPGCKTLMFPAVKTLTLDGNNISEWCVVNELEKLSSLQHLSCLKNPLMKSERSEETVRQLLIARIGQLQTLNKSQILPEERRGAELDYCRMFGVKWLECGGNRQPDLNHPSNQFVLEHPRFQFLINQYGAPEDGELKKEKPFALKNQLLNLLFVCPDEPGRAPIQKRIPDSMIVQKVKGLLYRLLKVNACEIHLSYVSSKMLGREFEINNDLKPLCFYSIEDGDTVLVRWS